MYLVLVLMVVVLIWDIFLLVNKCCDNESCVFFVDNIYLNL